MKPTDRDRENSRDQRQSAPRGNFNDRATLTAIARRAMLERGLEPDFSPAAQHELTAIRGPATATSGALDLRDRLWTSIDNDDSRDLDQLTVDVLQRVSHQRVAKALVKRGWPRLSGVGGRCAGHNRAVLGRIE